MKIRLSIFFILLSTITLYSQNVKINAKAHESYIGKTAELIIEKNNITNTYETLDAATIDSLGYFQFNTQIDKITQAFIKIEWCKGSIYLSPDYVYGIVFPKTETEGNLIQREEQTLNLSIIGKDSLELNALIIDFNIAFDKYWRNHYQDFVRRTHFKSLDSFEVKTKEKYKDLDNPYFKQYLNYTFANWNESTGRLKNFLAKKYLLNQAVLYNNAEYLKFINSYFKNYYQRKSFSKDSKTIYDVIDQNNIELLDAYLKSDAILKNDSLRHWVLCRNLFDLYYDAKSNKVKIKNIVNQLKSLSSFDYIKEICIDMLNTWNTEKVGTLAPNFALFDQNKKVIALNEFKNKYVYLQFFKSTNTQCLQELKKLQSLIKKYSDKVHFISVCLDDSLEAYQAFRKGNPTYNWQILYGGNEKKLYADYALIQTHQYYFLSKDHYIMRSPAASPSEGLESFFKKLFYKVK
jgi:peroxiredoxin